VKLTFLDHIMLLAFLSFFIGALLGFVGGVLTVRNNLAKAQKLDEKGKALLAALKKPD
jgi:F0F1-type ATP synthase assembly protein I